MRCCKTRVSKEARTEETVAEASIGAAKEFESQGKQAGKILTLGASGLLGRFRRDAPGIDLKTLQARRAVDPLPFPLGDGAKCLSAVDRASRPPYVHAQCERPRRGTAAAERPRGLEVRPGVVPDVLERAVELDPATADDVCRLQRLLRRVNRSCHHGEGGLKQRPREGRGGFVLLLFNTTRAHSPDPQARGPLSLWTEVWPTQPVLTQHPY